jgi:hypothetical protein
MMYRNTTMQIRTFVCIIVCILIAWSMVPNNLARAAERCFVETGFCISGRIQEYWEQNGGLPVFGLPIGPLEQSRIEGTLYSTQRFERNRLELHPENKQPYDVLLGRLGVTRLKQQNRDWFSFPKKGDTGGCSVFRETGFAVCGTFLTAFRSHGLQLDKKVGYTAAENIALFGLPISDAQVEKLSDGNEYLVQWFERARFEFHPENSAPYNVLFGLLGNEDYAFQMFVPPTATPTPVVVVMPTATVSPYLPVDVLDSFRERMPQGGKWRGTVPGMRITVQDISYTESGYPDFKYVHFRAIGWNAKSGTDKITGVGVIDLEGNTAEFAGYTACFGCPKGGKWRFLIARNSAPAQIYADMAGEQFVIELRVWPQEF